MCLGGKSNDGPVNPGSYAQWLASKKADARTAGQEYNETPASKEEYQKAVANYNANKVPDKEEEAVTEAEKTEAEKTEEDKEESTSDAIDDTTEVKGNAEKRPEVEDTTTTIKPPTKKPPTKKPAPKKPVDPERNRTPNPDPVETTEEEEVEASDSFLKNPKRKRKYSMTSIRRSGRKSRRSLITGTSGGGIGYYNKYLT